VQGAGISVLSNGNDITYTASGGSYTSGIDYAISLGATSGTRSVINAGGGNISLSGRWGTTGVAGNSDFATWLFGADIKTSG
jgi:hypothetical protein